MSKKNNDEISNSLLVLMKVQMDIAILKRTIAEEGNDSKPKTERTFLLLLLIYDYCEQLLRTIAQDLDLLRMERQFAEEAKFADCQMSQKEKAS